MRIQGIHHCHHSPPHIEATKAPTQKTKNHKNTESYALTKYRNIINYKYSPVEDLLVGLPVIEKRLVRIGLSIRIYYALPLSTLLLLLFTTPSTTTGSRRSSRSSLQPHPGAGNLVVTGVKIVRLSIPHAPPVLRGHVLLHVEFSTYSTWNYCMSWLFFVHSRFTSHFLFRR